MTIDLGALVDEARETAEMLMVDTCTINRPNDDDPDEGDYDPITRTYNPVGSAIYTGKCKVQTSVLVVRDEHAGDAEHAVEQWEIHLPVVGSESVRHGDVVTITAATYDAALLGRTFTVHGPHMGSMKSARRLPVEALVDA